ncbi:MAG: sodium-dependent bicarbonate transport family permease, partial [Planctomycetota bacterium]
MSLDLFIDNLLSPAVLFFGLGILATAVRSDLKVPEPVAKLFSLYLLWAIGFKGGHALREAGLVWETLTPVLAAVGFSIVVPLVLFPLFRTRLGTDDACGLAAAYGSVSVVTFLAATDFLEARQIEYGGEMVAALALMESPPIIVALFLRQLVMRGKTPDHALRTPKREIFRESLTSGPVFLLLGSLLAGLLISPSRFEPLRAFTFDIFHGVLVLFLLEAGIVAGGRMRELKKVGPLVLAAAVVVPVVNAAIGLGISAALGLSPGNGLLFMVLAASASYIAVPAVLRIGVPEANSGLFLSMS